MIDYFEHIEAYIDGNLEISVRADFEKKMRSDRSLKLAVENHPIAKRIANGLVEIEALEILTKIKAEKNNKVKRFRIGKWIGGVAAVGSVVFFSMWAMNNLGGQVDYAQLAAEYYISPKTNTTRGAETPEEPLEKAKYLFTLNDYGESREMLLQMLTDEENDEAPLYLAHISFLKGDFDSVESYLDQIDDLSLIDDAQFLLALNFICKENLTAAKKILSAIAQKDTRYSERANNLLKEIP